jgi:hypothetical protein
VNRLPPAQTKAEEIASYRFEEREIKRAKKKATRSVRDGSQSTILDFFGKDSNNTKKKKKKTTQKRFTRR